MIRKEFILSELNYRYPLVIQTIQHSEQTVGRPLLFERDGWTVRTRDRKPAAHYEFAVAVRKSGPDVLTDFSIIEQAIKN